MIMGAFIIFYKNQANIIGLLNYIRENKGVDYKKLYNSLSRGVESVYLMMQLYIIQMSDNKWEINPQHLNFINDVLDPLLFENIELQLVCCKNRIDFDKLFSANKEERTVEEEKLSRELDIVLFDGSFVVDGITEILNKHNLDDEILNNTPTGKAELM